MDGCQRMTYARWHMMNIIVMSCSIGMTCQVNNCTQEKVKDTMTVLDWQKQSRAIQRDHEQQLVQKEQAMLREQWAVEEQKEKQDAEQRFLLNRERNLELIQHNATEKQLREQAEQMERNRDKVLLDQALQKERAIEQYEADERLARRKEI